jgi:hypothetical protein
MPTEPHNVAGGEIEQELWAWLSDFVTVANEFYHFKFPPCPYARGALMAQTVDVVAWQSEDLRTFIRDHAIRLL